MISVNVKNGVLSEQEIEAYKARARELYPNRTIEAINITLDGDYADVEYSFASVPFQRIRRITGYLVGTLDRFNDAKRSEVEDRVKHDLTSSPKQESQAS